MKFLFKSLATVGIFLLLWGATSSSAAILTGSTGSHDPSRMIFCNGKYYICSTGGGMISSTDRINWSYGTSPFSSFSGSRPSSMKAAIPSDQGIWAPDIIFYNNKYYLYYSCAASDGLSCAIGLITSPTLDPAAVGYAWTDVGVVIKTDDKVEKKSAIDPAPFIDASNNLWLSWGSGYANGATWSDTTICISKLDNVIGLRSAADTNYYSVALGHIEGSYIHYHNGYYYAFWNSGGCCSGASSSYTVHLARSPTVTGTYVDKNGAGNSSVTFLSSTVVKNSINGNEHGPGHMGILSEGGIDRCTYHYYPDTGGSVIGEETVIWGADGWPTCGADLAPGTYRISSLNNGLAMGVYLAGTTNGTPLDQETYTGSTFQQWTLTYTTNGSTADGYYRIMSAGSSNVADLFQSSPNNGTPINQWASGGGNNQKWFIEQTSDGYYRIVSKISQSVIEVTNFSNTVGTALSQKVWNNGVNQEWLLTTTNGSLPSTPTGLVATPGAGQISLSWTSVGGATKYNVKRGTASGGPYATSIGGPTSASFTDTGVTNGITYYYVVSAVNAAGISGKSAPASATIGGVQPPPAAPSGLNATAVSAAQINLTWTDNSTNESNFLVERSSDGINFAQIDSVGAGVTNDASTGLSPSTLYYYRVRASNVSGNSAYSNTNSATTLAPPPGLTWRGDGAGNAWDVGVTANWISGGAGAQFVNGTAATFDDTGSNNVPVALTGTLQPSSLNVSAAKNYTFGGTGLIAGNASLVKSGNGSLTFTTSGNNSFSGGVTINGGIVALGADSVSPSTENQFALGTGPVMISTNGQLRFGGKSGGVQNFIITNAITLNGGTIFCVDGRQHLSNSIVNLQSGGGTLLARWGGKDLLIESKITGTGPLTFNYGGGSSPPGGALYLANPSNTYSGTLSILTNAVVLTTPFALSNAVLNAQGTGSSSNLIWSGISSITLGGLGGVGNIPLGANQLQVGNNDSSTEYSGALSGSGSLVKIGSGTFTLSGANTYSGTTTISNGTLQIGNGGATGSPGTGNIINNAALKFYRTNAIGFGGIISGAGDLDLVGGGTVTLSNANTYTGDTLIEAGMLALTGNGGIANTAGINISAGALLDVSGKNGGAMTLTGGIISGNGSVNGNFTIGNGAALSPGTFIGTMTFSNALTLAAGSTSFFEISKSPTASDLVKILGALTCGGTLQVDNISGNPLAIGDNFTLFDAASYNGGFATVTLPPLPAGLGWNTNLLNTSGTISVIITASPFIGSTAISSDGFVFVGTGGVANADFYLLGSTNLLSPVSNWTRLLTNQFDAGGNFNFTNSLVHDSLMNFFLLQIP